MFPPALTCRFNLPKRPDEASAQANNQKEKAECVTNVRHVFEDSAPETGSSFVVKFDARILLLSAGTAQRFSKIAIPTPSLRRVVNNVGAQDFAVTGGSTDITQDIHCFGVSGIEIHYESGAPLPARSEGA